MAGAPATYALDSHFEHVEPWERLNQYGYTWLERSKPGSTQWTRLDNGGSTAYRQIANLATAIMPASPRWDDRKGSAPAPTVMVQLERPAPVVQEIRVDAPAPRRLSLDTQLAALAIGVPAEAPKAVASAGVAKPAA